MLSYFFFLVFILRVRELFSDRYTTLDQPQTPIYRENYDNQTLVAGKVLHCSTGLAVFISPTSSALDPLLYPQFEMSLSGINQNNFIARITIMLSAL